LLRNSRKRDQKFGRFHQDNAAIWDPFSEYFRKALILSIASKQSIVLDLVAQALNQVLKIKGDKFAPFIRDSKNIPCSKTHMLRLMTGDPKIAPKVSLIAILSFLFFSFPFLFCQFGIGSN
jgi:hypothetical protein